MVYTADFGGLDVDEGSNPSPPQKNPLPVRDCGFESRPGHLFPLFVYPAAARSFSSRSAAGSSSKPMRSETRYKGRPFTSS